jgi:hypothetical protein
LPAQDGSEDKMQQSTVRIIIRMVAKQGADLVFGSVKVLVVNQSGNLCRWTGAGTGIGGG